MVPRGLTHLLPHAPVPAAGEDAVHQLAADGVLPLFRRHRPDPHRLHRRRREERIGFCAGGRIGVWLHSDVPDGRQSVDVLQCDLWPSSHRFRSVKTATRLLRKPMAGVCSSLCPA